MSEPTEQKLIGDTSQVSPMTRNEAISKYISLVDKVANRLISRLPANIELDDIKSAGIIGLIDAAEKYNETKGSSFKVYAEIRIYGAIMDELRSQDWVPRSVRQSQAELKVAEKNLSQSLGRTPSEYELAQYLNMSIEEYHKLSKRANAKRFIHFDDLVKDPNSNRNILDVIPDDRQLLPQEQEEYNEQRYLMTAALKRLPERQREILRLYYFEELRLKEIGEILSVTESRVSQIHAHAVERLKMIIKELEQVGVATL